MKEGINMAIFKYETKQSIKYGCRGYLGIDELTGKQININKRGFDTAKAADLYFMKEKLKFADGERTKKAKEYTFREIYTQWLDVYENTVKESTFAKVKTHFKLHILPKFGNMRIAKIKSSYIQTVLNGWHKEFKQFKLIYNYVNRVMRYALLQRIIQENPCDLVHVPTKKLDYGIDKTTKDFYTKNELQEFLQVIEKHEDYNWYTMFRLFAFTGIRRGELLALTWKDVDFEKSILSVNKTLAEGINRELIIQSPKSNSGIREITLDKITVQTLRNWKTKQAEILMGFGQNALNKNQLIFSQLERNKFLNLGAPRNALVRITKKHDLEMVNIHGFRHTHCSLLFEADVPMKDVMERLGHADIQTTMNIYTHVTQDSRDKSAELFAKYANF